MSNDPTRKHPRDPYRINIHDQWEVDFWTKRIGCTRAQLVVAVHTVGPMMDSVIAFLREVAPRARLQAVAVKSGPVRAVTEAPPSFDASPRPE